MEVVEAMVNHPQMVVEVVVDDSLKVVVVMMVVYVEVVGSRNVDKVGNHNT